ncbi:MAG TPA: hypothetical protein VMR65_10285 [Candidatus Sulfotelmatobacter sp.]|jgi:SAM-dependent methyltransferase|nr:hypothetical protein [Candidatus Sulfotelmatobacter sp.]
MSKAGPGRDSRGALLPAELTSLFDDRFHRSCELVEEYVHRLTRRVFDRLELARASVEPGSWREIASRAGLSPERARVPLTWMFRTLAARGVLAARRDADGTERFVLASGAPALDPDEMVEAQRRHDASALPAYALAALAAEEYPRFLRGEAEGEEILFGPGRLPVWEAYFSNENPLYAVSNVLGAIAAEGAFPASGGEILEVGAGLGSAAAALMSRLAGAGLSARVTSHRFTDSAIPFLRRAQRSLGSHGLAYPLTFGRLDMNRPFSEAGVAPGSAALVYAVNVLHVAADLGFTLREIRIALRGDGALVFAECVRPRPEQPVYVELVFNLLTSFRSPKLEPTWRPTGGFLTPEQWADALRANGFAPTRMLPEVAALRDALPSLVVTAITARPA